jgi:hypothetical protein
MTTVALPSPPEGFADQFRAKATLHSTRMRLANGATYQQILEFDGRDLNDFTSEVDAFSVREIRPSE